MTMETTPKCRYCGGRHKCCGKKSPPKETQYPNMTATVAYLCTRPEGHDGQCVACGQDNHKIAAWGDPFHAGH